jgi:hypothetical protein
MVNRSQLLSLSDTWKAENKEININVPKKSYKNKLSPHKLKIMKKISKGPRNNNKKSNKIKNWNLELMKSQWNVGKKFKSKNTTTPTKGGFVFV